MSWINSDAKSKAKPKIVKNKAKPKIVFAALGIILVVVFLISELGSYLIINKYKKKYQIDPKILGDLLAAVDRMNHVRHFDSNVDYGSIDQLIFSENIATKSAAKNQNLLIQGDSWAEQFINYTKSDLLTRRLKSLEDKWKVTYAGTSSYSPSLMTAQLDFFREKYDLAPNYIVAIVDQTDFGDELCRYRNVRQKNKDTGVVKIRAFDPAEGTYQGVYSVKQHIRYSVILSSSQLSSLKLFKLAYYKALLHLAEPKDCGWEEISRPLINSLTADDQKYIIEVFADYLKAASKFESMEKIIFVTHPHRNHLNGIYNLEMGKFIEGNLAQIVKMSGVEIDVKHLAIHPPKSRSGEVYKKNDLASHLTDEAHSTYYLSAIKSEIEK